MVKVFDKYLLSRLLVIFNIIAFLSITSGCHSTQRGISNEQLLDQQSDFVKQLRQENLKVSTQAFSRIKNEYNNASKNIAQNLEQVHDVLILSGGGKHGAFGAGFLQGWGNVTVPEFTRPEFDSVSGISTGALIAPFAFIGSDDAYREIVNTYENPPQKLVRKRNLFSYLFQPESLLNVDIFDSMIQAKVSSELIQNIAEGHQQGRMLLVGASNLDYGILRIWNLADVAGELPNAVAQEKISKVLLASSAIPSIFPPVLIENYLYADGGASMQIISSNENREWLYDVDSQLFEFVDHKKPIKVRVWMIINQKLLPDPEVTRLSWIQTFKRSLHVLVRTSLLQSIYDAKTFVQLLDKHPFFEAELRFVAIPQDYSIPETDDLFDKNVMQGLVVLGRKMGADPSSWKTQALLPGAPFDTLQ